MLAVRTAAMGVPAPRARGTSRALVDVAALAESVVRMFGKAAGQREIDLVSSTTGPVEVWGNALQLKQIVANLVVNALKFAPAGGRVRVATRTASSGLAEIAVSDNGPGVPLEDRGASSSAAYASSATAASVAPASAWQRCATW